MSDAKHTAGLIADEIIKDLRNRRGLSHEWDAIDEDVRTEIRSEWVEIARKHTADRVNACDGLVDPSVVGELVGALEFYACQDVDDAKSALRRWDSDGYGNRARAALSRARGGSAAQGGGV